MHNFGSDLCMTNNTLAWQTHNLTPYPANPPPTSSCRSHSKFDVCWHDIRLPGVCSGATPLPVLRCSHLDHSGKHLLSGWHLNAASAALSSPIVFSPKIFSPALEINVSAPRNKCISEKISHVCWDFLWLLWNVGLLAVFQQRLGSNSSTFLLLKVC